MVGYQEDNKKPLGSSSISGIMSTSTPLKRRRITRACDRCHKGGTKCTPGDTPDVCGPCSAFGSKCTYDRPLKRRGPAARANSQQDTSNHTRASSSTTPNSNSPSHSDAHWIYNEIASHEEIEELIETFYRIIYPIQPFFHWPTFTSAIQSRLYTRSRPFHCLVMSSCALASSRIRDGAPSCCNLKYNYNHDNTSESFYQSALASFPSDLAKALDFDYKRAKVLLSMVCIQYGDIANTTIHIGDYCTLCSLDGFHTESRWPKDLNEIEIQERRRLFWSAYTVDVYTATTFSGIIRHREAQTTVLYPAEVLSDDLITTQGIIQRSSSISPDKKSFLMGWNFVTNLYRILEHAVCQMRQRSQSYDSGNQIAMLFTERKFGSSDSPGPEEILATVESLYDKLPHCFKGIKEMSGDVDRDRYGYQAANIMITLQTVKMVMAGMAEWSVEQRCAIAGELLDSLAAMPRSFMQACSSPMLHHLAGVGHLLASIICTPLSPTTYCHVRTVLLRMADLLASLESTIKSASTLCIGEKLRDHVERIDKYMMSATEATGWNFALGATNLVSDTPIRTPPIYPPLEPLISSCTNVTTPNSSAQRTTQLNEIPSTTGLPIYQCTAGLNSNGNVDNGLLPQSESQQLGQQFQLPNDLFSDWSYMFNEFGSQGDAFDFLSTNNGDWQYNPPNL